MTYQKTKKSLTSLSLVEAEMFLTMTVALDAMVLISAGKVM